MPYFPQLPWLFTLIICHECQSQEPPGRRKHPQRNLPIKDSMGILERTQYAFPWNLLCSSWRDDVLPHLLTTLSYIAWFLSGTDIAKKQYLAYRSLQFIFSNWTGKDGRESTKPLFCLFCASSFHINWDVIAASSVILEAYNTLCLDLDMDAWGINLSLPPCYFPTKCFYSFTGFILKFFL